MTRRKVEKKTGEWRSGSEIDVLVRAKQKGIAGCQLCTKRTFFSGRPQDQRSIAMRPRRGQCTNLDSCSKAQSHQLVVGEYIGTELCCPECKRRLTPPPEWPHAYLSILALVFLLMLSGAGFWTFQHRTSTEVTSKPPEQRNAAPFENGQNTIGMKFVNVPQTGIYWSIWGTRLVDFKHFIKEHPDKSPGEMFSLAGEEDQGNPWRQIGCTWDHPEFTQTDVDPVVGVNPEDAQAFCDWLNEKESARLKKYHFEYRLPTAEEWRTAAAYQGTYPWGNDWSGLLNAKVGNYAGAEAREDKSWPTDFKTIPHYRDGYPRSSPVGSFPPNQSGLYDMDGNVSEWCSIKSDNKASMVVCGGSWYSADPDELEITHQEKPPNGRSSYIGFRVVVAPKN